MMAASRRDRGSDMDDADMFTVYHRARKRRGRGPIVGHVRARLRHDEERPPGPVGRVLRDDLPRRARRRRPRRVRRVVPGRPVRRVGADDYGPRPAPARTSTSRSTLRRTGRTGGRRHPRTPARVSLAPYRSTSSADQVRTRPRSPPAPACSATPTTGAQLGLRPVLVLEQQYRAVRHMVAARRRRQHRRVAQHGRGLPRPLTRSGLRKRPNPSYRWPQRCPSRRPNTRAAIRLRCAGSARPGRVPPRWRGRYPSWGKACG